MIEDCADDFEKKGIVGLLEARACACVHEAAVAEIGGEPKSAATNRVVNLENEELLEFLVCCCEDVMSGGGGPSLEATSGGLLLAGGAVSRHCVDRGVIEWLLVFQAIVRA